MNSFLSSLFFLSHKSPYHCIANFNPYKMAFLLEPSSRHQATHISHIQNISANFVLGKGITSCRDTCIDAVLFNGNRRLCPGSKAASMKLNTDLELYTFTPPYVLIICWIINFTLFTL
jgi:hypothetical protein